MKRLKNTGQKFAGNPFTCFYTLFLFVLMAGLLIIDVVVSSNRNTAPVLLIVFPILYFILGIQMNYFVIDNESKNLLVRNHYFFWLKKNWAIQDIISARVERRYYLTSKMLRLTMKDSEHWRYPAGSLRKKHWEALITRLVLLGIKIR